MMKKYIYFAAALLSLASCANEEFTGDESLREAPISFGFDVPTATRAEDAAAATALSNQFIVYAEKGETDGSAPASGNLVFQNYKVTYTASTAYTTTSNTDDWEYVGLSWTSDEQSHITTSTTDVQTIKFWDDAAASYTFTAVSALPADISSGRVAITKATSGSDQYAKGYSIVLAKSGNEAPYTYPDLSKLYFADRKYIEKGGGYSHNAVKMDFRNTQSHVRVGVFETIPGYKVSAIHFFKQDGTTEYTDGATPTPTNAFGAVCPNISGTNYEGTLTVTYGNASSGIENQPIVSVSGSSAADLVLGTNLSTLTVGNASAEPAIPAKFLGEAANAATYDTNGGGYTIVMPQTATSNLKLKVNYTLYNEITHETITITGKTAEIPKEYLSWKPNYKYTYLFKITDDDLNPITFDAAVIEAADGTAEYITTVSEPSITTFGVKGNKYQHGNNQYEATSDVYATIVDGGAVIDPTGKYNIYTVTTTNATTYPITEASVAESLAEVSAKTHQVTCAAYTTNVSLVTTVPGEDGNDITLAAGKAIKLEGLAAGTYAVEYVKTARTLSAQEVTYATSAEFTTALSAVNLYSNSGCTTPAEAGDYGDATTKFYKQVVSNAGTYAYKVIIVE